MWVYMYESVVRTGDMNITTEYPVVVNKRYIMDTTPIPRYDVPRLHQAETLFLFGAGREKRVYAVPPYTTVVPLQFEDYPFKTEHNPAQCCERCGSNDTYLTQSFVEPQPPSTSGRWMYLCSDTSFCEKRAQAREQRETTEIL
jgi:alpha-D-ribose 1-methylphosphonate 5-phosphate C-P lyase